MRSGRTGDRKNVMAAGAWAGRRSVAEDRPAEDAHWLSLPGRCPPGKRPRRSSPDGTLAASIPGRSLTSVTATHALVAVARATPAPGSTAWVGCLASDLIMLGLGLGAVWSVFFWREVDDGDDSDHGDDGGGWGGHGTPRGRPPDGDPEWWPEFERQFAEHVTGTIEQGVATHGVLNSSGASTISARAHPRPERRDDEARGYARARGSS